MNCGCRYLSQDDMGNARGERMRIAVQEVGRRAGLLFSVFFLIAFGLGYPVLSRFDPRLTPGLSDVKTYAAMVDGTVSVDAGHMRFRVLVPWVAKPFYRIARGRFASWDPVMFGLLMADSLFVAGTAVLIVLLGRFQFARPPLGHPAMGLVGALLYLANFAVPNLRLVGLVDAGEGFFLLALMWTLLEDELWVLPGIAVLGTLTKESFVPFSVAITAAWWLLVRRERSTHRADAAWIGCSWGLSLATMIGLQWSISGELTHPMQFGLALHRGHDYFQHFMYSLLDRNLWYVFVWLLPTAIPNLKRFPSAWLMPVGVTCALAFVLDGYYGGNPGTVGRALFSIAGPLLSLSSGVLLLRMADFSLATSSGSE